MENEIKEMIKNRIAGIKNRNIEKAIEDYSDEVISYDVVGQLKFSGKDAIKERLKQWLSTLSEIIDYEIADVEIVSSSDTAFCSCLNHINAINNEGKKLDMWWRETTCYSRESGKIKITHSHSSVPFDPESGMASLGLKPDFPQ